MELFFYIFWKIHQPDSKWVNLSVILCPLGMILRDVLPKVNIFSIIIPPLAGILVQLKCDIPAASKNVFNSCKNRTAKEIEIIAFSKLTLGLKLCYIDHSIYFRSQLWVVISSKKGTSVDFNNVDIQYS